MNTDTPPNCMDDFDPDSLSLNQALALIESQIEPLSTIETVALRDALDRVLAASVISPVNVPGHTNSAMDGYAIRGIDLPAAGQKKQFTLVGKILAGAPISTTLQQDECARIMTGGKMPDGADTVVMQEHVTVDGKCILIAGEHTSGQNVRQAGEDISVGQPILQAGKRLTAADIGLLASIGISEIGVIRRIRVAFFSTGDELRSIGEALEDGQIYDSNRYTLFGMLKRLGADLLDMGRIVDDAEKIRQSLIEAAKNADVLITSGGVSVGEADYVTTLLRQVGQVNFWKIAMKPGRPLAFGRINSCLFFGLPGNPVSAMVTFYQIVMPALTRLAGQSRSVPLILKLPCTSTIRKRAGRIEYQRGVMLQGENGQLSVRTTGSQSSGVLSSMSEANCFIVLPMENDGVSAGEIVSVQPFAGLI